MAKRKTNDLFEAADQYLQEAIIDVARVFNHGEEKHGDDWKKTLFVDHLVHARSHLCPDALPWADEKESGLPHLAHAAARCILALAVLKRGG